MPTPITAKAVAATAPKLTLRQAFILAAECATVVGSCLALHLWAVGA